MSQTENAPLATQLARASWVAPLLVVGTNLLLRQTESRDDTSHAVVFTVIALVFAIVGLTSGIAAVFAVRRQGRKDILLPAAIGIVLSAFFLGILALGVRSGLANAPQRQLETAASISSANSPEW
jgi:glucose uptake protein GlcU